MTDEHDEQLDPVSPDLSVEDEARLRALLSDARETGPVPADVAARLDDALVGLAAERLVSEPEPTPATGSEATILPLVRTRRHRAVAFLGAAAAVAVVGLGIGAVVDQDSDGVGDSAARDSQVDRGSRAGAEAEVAKSPAKLDDDAAADGTDAPWELQYTSERAYVVRTRHLTRDLTRIQHDTFLRRDTEHYRKTVLHQPKGFVCEAADWGRGVLVAVKYDGAPAYVAFRQPMGASQVVEVLQCGTAEVLRSATLPTDR